MAVNETQRAIDKASEEAKKYRKYLTAELTRIDEGIDALAANIKQANVEVQAHYEARLQDLDARKRLVEIKLTEFQQSSESAIETVKQGMETVWNDLVETFEQVSKDFGDQQH